MIIGSWQPANPKPVIEGLYQIRGVSGKTYWSYWSGKEWRGFLHLLTASRFLDRIPLAPPIINQNYPWRGVQHGKSFVSEQDQIQLHRNKRPPRPTKHRVD
jgi:hypothetical protein